MSAAPRLTPCAPTNENWPSSPPTSPAAAPRPSPAQSSTPTSAPISARSMIAASPKPLPRVRWPPFAVGSSGWPAPGASSRTRLAGGHAPPAQAPAPRALHRADESRGRFGPKTPPVGPRATRAILELLYGCGIRNAELTGLNLDDIHWANEAILIRGKGQKQRYVPLGDAAPPAPCAPISPNARRSLAAARRHPKRLETPALFSICGCAASPTRAPLGGEARSPPAHHPQRRPHRQAHRHSARPLRRRASAHPAPRLRNVICWKKAPTCAPFRSCRGHERLSTTQRYTQLTTAQSALFMKWVCHRRGLKYELASLAFFGFCLGVPRLDMARS
jgi:integrase